MATFTYKKKKYVNGVDYDKTIDYSAEMEKAKAAGDSARLAALEEKRNRKIEGENLSERKTYNYIDIGTKIQEGIRNNISPDEIKELVDARRDKAYQNKQYDIYKNDEIQKQGLRYYYDAMSGAGAGHSNRPEEERSYDERIESLLNKISNVKSFEYNPEDDAAYLALKSQMQNESRRAATDVLAEVQQQGGGKSSYAVSAASLAANNFNAKLMEEIPRLQELAYKRYYDSLEGDRKALDFALKASEKEHDEYQDSLKQFNEDREYARDAYEKDLDRYGEEDERAFDQKMELYDMTRENQKMARDTIEHYEKSGVSAPVDLLKEAGLENYESINKESASIYRNKLDLDALVKSRQVANYNARTAKTYNDMALATKKANNQNSKNVSNTSAPEINNAADVQNINMTNRKDAQGVEVDGKFVNMTKFIVALKTGEIIGVLNNDGTYTFMYKKK